VDSIEHIPERRLQYTAGTSQITIDGTDFTVVPNGVIIKVASDSYQFMPWHRVHKVTFNPSDLDLVEALRNGHCDYNPNLDASE
jgi:hypothetical protein